MSIKRQYSDLEVFEQSWQMVKLGLVLAVYTAPVAFLAGIVAGLMERGGLL